MQLVSLHYGSKKLKAADSDVKTLEAYCFEYLIFEKKFRVQDFDQKYHCIFCFEIEWKYKLFHIIFDGILEFSQLWDALSSELPLKKFPGFFVILTPRKKARLLQWVVFSVHSEWSTFFISTFWPRYFSSDITFQRSDVKFSKFRYNVFKVRIYLFQSLAVTFSKFSYNVFKVRL